MENRGCRNSKVSMTGVVATRHNDSYRPITVVSPLLKVKPIVVTLVGGAWFWSLWREYTVTLVTYFGWSTVKYKKEGSPASLSQHNEAVHE